MKTLITLILAFTLTACSWQHNAYEHATVSFSQACQWKTMEANISHDGDKLTLTATCTKEK